MHVPLELAVRGTDRRYPLLEGARLTVGRVKACDVHLEDGAVSRRHCLVDVQDGAVVVTDLESANGTFVNDRLIRSARLRPGDRLRVGSVEFEILGAAPPRAAPVDPMLDADDTTMASVIRKQFDPSRFEWLASMSSAADTGSADLGLLQRAHRHLSMLHYASEVLASARDLPQLADATLGAILEVTGADRAALVLRRRDPLTGGVEVAAARSRVRSPERFVVSRTLVSDVIEKGVSTFAYDAVNDARFNNGESVVGQRVRSVMCVPLRTADEILGAMYVDSVSAPGRFSEPDLELLAALGNQAGVALHRVRLIGELERLLLDTISAIAATIDAKDGYTHRHSERVAALSGRLAVEMGLDADERRTVHLAALLHDVGKIAVPDSILNKPGRLTPEEFEEMKQHPVHGERILANIKSPSVAAILPGVKYHHERWDGGGYPDGLAGDDIPPLGRLLCVADVYDAVTSARAYRGAMSPEQALDLVREGAGTHFDPRVVRAAVALHERGQLAVGPDEGEDEAPAVLDAP